MKEFEFTGNIYEDCEGLIEHCEKLQDENERLRQRNGVLSAYAEELNDLSCVAFETGDDEPVFKLISDCSERVAERYIDHNREIAALAVENTALHFAKNGMPDDNFSKSLELHANKIRNGDIGI